MGHFVSSPREREKRDRIDSRRDEREGQGRKRNRNESEETEEIKTSPPYPYLLQSTQVILARCEDHLYKSVMLSAYQSAIVQVYTSDFGKMRRPFIQVGHVKRLLV